MSGEVEQLGVVEFDTSEFAPELEHILVENGLKIAVSAVRENRGPIGLFGAVAVDPHESCDALDAIEESPDAVREHEGRDPDSFGSGTWPSYALQRAERDVAWGVHRETSKVGVPELSCRVVRLTNGLVDMAQHPRVGYFNVGVFLLSSPIAARTMLRASAPGGRSPAIEKKASHARTSSLGSGSVALTRRSASAAGNGFWAVLATPSGSPRRASS